MSKVHIKRYAYGGRYRVMLDGQTVGEITNGRRKGRGPYVLYLKGWYWRGGLPCQFGGKTGERFPLLRTAVAKAAEVLSAQT